MSASSWPLRRLPALQIWRLAQSSSGRHTAHLTGRVFDDTSKFDDLPMLDAPNSWRIAGIAVWGGKVVNGIRITYERGGMLKSSRELVGHDDGPHEWEQIELRPGEEIVKVEAVISYRIEKLTFRTSQSRHGTFGRGTEGDVHELSVPSVRCGRRLAALARGSNARLSAFKRIIHFCLEMCERLQLLTIALALPRAQEHRLVAFHGGVGGSLHTFGFWTLPLPTSFLNRDEPMPGLMLLVRSQRICYVAAQHGSHVESEALRGLYWADKSAPALTAGTAREARFHRRRGWKWRA